MGNLQLYYQTCFLLRAIFIQNVFALIEKDINKEQANIKWPT